MIFGQIWGIDYFYYSVLYMSQARFKIQSLYSFAALHFLLLALLFFKYFFKYLTVGK